MGIEVEARTFKVDDYVNHNIRVVLESVDYCSNRSYSHHEPDQTKVQQGVKN